jgi:hypothetical protein
MKLQTVDTKLQESFHSSSWQAPSAVGSKIVFRQDNGLRREAAVARSINFGELIRVGNCQGLARLNIFRSKDRFGPIDFVVTRTVSRRERRGGIVGEKRKVLLFENFAAD